MANVGQSDKLRLTERKLELSKNLEQVWAFLLCLVFSMMGKGTSTKLSLMILLYLKLLLMFNILENNIS